MPRTGSHPPALQAGALHTPRPLGFFSILGSECMMPEYTDDTIYQLESFGGLALKSEC